MHKLVLMVFYSSVFASVHSVIYLRGKKCLKFDDAKLQASYSVSPNDYAYCEADNHINTVISAEGEEERLVLYSYSGLLQSTNHKSNDFVFLCCWNSEK